MTTKLKSLFLPVFLLCLAAPGASAAPGFGFGSSGWKYLLGNAEASTPTNAWRAIVFNDSSWTANATAPIGFDNNNTPGTTVPAIGTQAGATGLMSIYFRKTFVVNDLAAILDATVQAEADDGLVVWVNGIEVGRANVPAGELGYSAAAVGAAEINTVSTTNVVSLLVAGTNVLAIHAFNANNTSSDLVMDATLIVTEDSSPFVASTAPLPNSTVTALTYAGVIFDKNVTGVDVSDLTINGGAATGFLVVSPREYQWTFAQPPTGTVNFVLAPGGISDTVGAPSLFAGTNWSCTLDPNAIAGGARITEFVADNENGLEDEDGSRGDWVEIYNPGPTDQNMGGWYLTDTQTNLTKWRFPSIVIQANKYLIVMASGKDRTNVLGPYLHANFQLSTTNGYLALVDPGLNVVSSFAPTYPVQFTDTSYGEDGLDPVIKGYFLVPTPGSNNMASGSSLAQEPVMSLADGIYTNNSLTLTITAPAGSVIRYTYDGLEPTGSSAGGVSPLNITFTTNMMIKARVYQTNQPALWPSRVVGRKFIMLDSSTANFSSDLPIMIFSTQGRLINRQTTVVFTRQRGQFVSIDTHRGRASLTGPVDAHEFSAHELVGQTSFGFPKQPHRLEINDETGNDKDVSILGLPAEADWNLRNPYSDKCLMNDFLGYELWEDMGQYSCRRRFVELFVDTGGTSAATGKLNYPGDYYGVMVLFERIERSKKRVDIAELTRFHTNEPAISGGYIVKKDKNPDPFIATDLDFNTSGGAGFSGQGLKMHEPKPAALNYNASHPQVAWIRNYLNRFEAALYAANWTNASVLGTTNHYSFYIDVDKFVDQHLHVEFTRQIDGYRLSSYYSKDRGGKFGPTPVWDWNLSFGNANYYNGGLTNGWYFASDGENQHPWLRRLNFGNTGIAGTAGDPDFRQKTTDRWSVLRTNALNGSRVADRIDQLASNLTESAARNFSKYNILNTYIWPNPEGGTWHVDYTKATYPEIITEMKKWVTGRYTWMDEQFMRAPVASVGGGVITPGTVLNLTAAEGTIYYTTNGVDPRLPGGGLSPAAVAYSGPITVNGNARLFARSRNLATGKWTPWSPPLDATYIVQTPRLVITEIMYHPPAPPMGSPYTNAQDFEYVELRNTGGASLNVTGARLTGGIDFTFPALTLAAGQRVLVVGNLAAFSSRYNTNGLLIAGQFTGTLANEGNRLVVTGPLNEPILDFSYNNSWYPVTDGLGFSLVINDDTAAFNTWGLATSWRASGSLNGSPGLDNGAPPSFSAVVINEVLTHSDVPPPTDTIELRNLSGSPAPIGGWFLTDDRNTPKKFRIAPGTSIGANGYLAFSEADFNSGTNGNIPFALSSLGDEVYLFSGDANTNLTGYLHGFDYGAQFNGRTFGRYLISSGEDHFVAMSSSTLGNPNSGPLVGPIVISEIHYHPVDFVNQYGSFDNTEDEYIELHNISGASVSLFDPANPGNRWKLRDAVDFTFPPGTNLPAGGYALVVSFDPSDAAALAAFRANNSVPVNVPVFGPFTGQLDNSTDSVELVAPDAPTNGIAPYVLIDKVRYTDTTPWPAGADGIGLSLQRTVEPSYGNDATNWVAGGRSPGASFVYGPPPVITLQPQDTAAPATLSAMLSVRASGTPPLSYQWRHRPVGSGSFSPKQGATSSNLVFNSVQTSDEGDYDCIVANTAGSVTSSNATLTVYIPASISSQPTNLTRLIPPSPGAAPSTTAVFRVVASTDNPPLTFRWQFNGEDIALDETNYYGITSSTLTISNVNAAHAGSYRCAVSDAVATIFSQSATLTTLVIPIVIIPPQSQTIYQGDPLTLTVVISNASTLPFNYIWRSNSTIIASNHMVASFTNSIVITNVPPIASNLFFYRCDVQNPAQPPQGVASASARITTITTVDRDGDGINDPWEQRYGFSTNNAADAYLDPDGDGMINLYEFQADTVPTNALSLLKVTDYLLGANETFNFLAVSNRTYSVLTSGVLPGLPWASMTNISATTGNRTIRLTNPPPADTRFLRLVTPQQP